jgi:quinol monooxygenase YgiN
MIVVVVKIHTSPEWTARWPGLVQAFTTATRAEDGNLWFEWSQSLDDPCEYVLFEVFRDERAGEAHLASDHFQAGIRALKKALDRPPRSIRLTMETAQWNGWEEVQLGE